MEISKLSVKEIDKFFDTMDIEESLEYIEELSKDNRSSVRKIGEKLNKRYEKSVMERNRVKDLWTYEHRLFQKGYECIVGMDEAGRGPLAGPVVAGAVILPKDLFIEGINDSKKISPKKRELLYDIIKEKAIGVGVGIADHETIDQINIFNATKLAMKRAIENIDTKVDHLLIDAVHLKEVTIPQLSITKGDSLSISIAAASIIAKVTRDRIMEQYDKVYPQYGFIHHKGYGTKEHYEKIKLNGISPIHRKSFLKNLG